MRGDKPKQARKPGLLFLGFSLALGLAVLSLFTWQKGMLNREFDSLIAGNLDTHVQNRTGKIASDIANTRAILRAAASLVQTTGLSPEGEPFKKVLSQFGSLDSARSISYIPIQNLETSILAGSSGRLARGEFVVTDILYCNNPESSNYYICVPVWQGGAIAGVLYARMRAQELVRVEPDGLLYKDVRTCLADSSGKLLFVNEQTRPSGSIYNGMREQGVADAAIERLAVILRGQQGTSTQFIRKRSTYFVSVGEIGYNDWHLVTFLRGPDVLVRSDQILQSVMVTGAALVLLTTGACFGIYAMFVADRKKLEREQRRYAMLAQFSDTMLFEYNRASDSVEFTSNARARLSLNGLSIHNVTDPNRANRIFHPDDQDKVREIFHEPKEEGLLYYTELRIKGPDGRYMWYGCQYKAQEAAGKGLPVVVGKLVDITNQRSREQRLEENARRDILTGTYNKSGAEMIDELLQGRPHGVLIMMDIDRFKRINDTYGHVAGDAVLAQFGRMLNEIFRKGDIVARVGGDEFVVFLPGLHDPEMVRERTEDILSRIRTISIGDGSMVLTASAGIAIAPQDGVTFQEIYSIADKAMYAAKQKLYAQEGQ